MAGAKGFGAGFAPEVQELPGRPRRLRRVALVPALLLAAGEVELRAAGRPSGAACAKKGASGRTDAPG